MKLNTKQKTPIASLQIPQGLSQLVRLHPLSSLYQDPEPEQECTILVKHLLSLCLTDGLTVSVKFSSVYLWAVLIPLIYY